MLIPARKICMVRMSALGDVVNALALANGLRHGYPDAEITWVIQPVPYEIVCKQPAIDRFIIFNRKGGIREWRKMWRELRSQKFDLFLVPQVSFKASLITAIARADIKVGYDSKRSRELQGLFTNARVPPKEPSHVLDQFMEFLEFTGIMDYSPEWNFRFLPEELEWQSNFFKPIKRPVIGFVATSSKPEKDWAWENYVSVMDRVNTELDCQPVIIGGPGKLERECALKIKNACECDPILALEKPIRHTMLQLQQCSVVVSPDTGPLHAAVAMKVPTVGIYGYSNPRRCGPYKCFQDLLIDRFNDPDKPLEPITRKTKLDRMHLITPDEVFNKIKLALEKYPN